MEFSIHKKPTKVSLTGLAGFGLYFAVAVAFFRSNEYYYLILGGGVWGLVMLFIKSIASIFISTYTVTENSIETVTPVGGIIRINFDNLDWDRTHLSEGGLLLTPQTGETISLSITEFSRQDIARLAHHIGITDAGWFQEL
jgi:hypothetical protein